MSELIKKLLDYQEVDLQLKTIEDEILKTEEAQKYYAARKFLSTVKDTLQAFEDKAERLLIRYNNALKEVDEMKKTAAECKTIVESCEDESELNYISKKFKSAVDALSRREQEINDVIKEMEDLSREVVKLNKQNKVMREQFAAYKPKFEELRAQKTDEVKALKDKMAEIGATIDKQVMDKYQLKRKDLKFPIICDANVNAKTKSVYCPRCGSNQSITAYERLEAGELYECETCRRVLYDPSKIK